MPPMLLKSFFPKASRLRDLVELALKESGVEGEDIQELVQWIKHHIKGFKSDELPLDQVLPLLLSVRAGKVRKLAHRVDDVLEEVKKHLAEIAAVSREVDAVHTGLEELAKSLADSSSLAASRLSALEASLKDGSSVQKLTKKVAELDAKVAALEAGKAEKPVDPIVEEKPVE